MLDTADEVFYFSGTDFSPGYLDTAQDFNHDVGQELGIGLAVSAIRDFITVGYGYNVVQGAKYWFFGLRLPVPGLTINGTKTN